jgi:hypothetical protein
MESPHNVHPLLEIFISVTLFASSAFLGFLTNLDLILSVVAKLVAIGAGCSTIILAYINYKKSLKGELHNKKSSD